MRKWILLFLLLAGCIRKDIIKRPPQDVEAMEKKAVALYKEGKEDEALSLFYKLAKSCKGHPSGYRAEYYIGLIYEKRKDYDRAALHYSTALKGKVYEAKKRLLSISDFLSPSTLEKTGKKHPDIPELFTLYIYLAGKKYMDEKNTKKSHALFKLLVDRYPESYYARKVRKYITRKGEIPRIGVLLPLSGKYAGFGEEVRRGIELRLEGEVELEYYDTGGDEIKAYMGAKELIEKGVKGIIGPLFNWTLLTVAAFAEFYRIPFVSPTASNVDIETLNPYITIVNRSLEAEAKALARFAISRGFKKFAILYPYNTYGRIMEEYFSSTVEDMGGEIAIRIPYKPGKADFRNEIKRIREASPEAIFIPAYPEEVALIAPELKYYQVGYQVFGGDGWYGEDVVTKTGKKYLEGVVCASLPYNPDPAFVKLYHEKYGEEPTRYVGLGWDAGEILMSILKKKPAGSLVAGFSPEDKHPERKVPLYIIARGKYTPVTLGGSDGKKEEKEGNTKEE